MNAQFERKLRVLGVIVTASVIGAIGFVLARGYTSASAITVGISYGLLLSVALGGISLFVLQGPMRIWLGGLSFSANLAVRSAIYAAIILPVLFFQLGYVIAGAPLDSSNFWIDVIYSIACVVLVNLVLGIANIIGPRAFLNFISGRYHTPIEEKRFVPFVDIAGSTGLAERLGGLAIHRLLDRTFRLLTLARRGLSRRSAQLCRRRGDRDLAGTPWCD
jgi:adenylate cyclase